MRDSGLVGLTGIPLVIALLLVVPLATRRQATPVGTPTAIDTAFIVADLKVDSVERFRIGRDLLAEVTGTADLDALRVLIALLPDPDESSLDWTYDAHLAALRRALEKVGYLSDRMWFPTRSDSATVTRAGRTVKRPAPDLLPGVMLFRGEAGRSTTNLAIVYTVGEIPTTGVHREALRTALREARALMDATLRPTDPEVDHAVRTDTLRILGPTFSGSAPSLRAVLEQERPARCRPVRIMSGSATSPQARAMLDFPLPCGEDEVAGRSAAVTFGATVHTDAEYSALIAAKLLAPLGLRAEDVALLSEANTLYGEGASRAADPLDASAPDPVSSRRTLQDLHTVPAECAEVPNVPFVPVELCGQRAMLDEAMSIPFPLNIASVRTEYDRLPETSTEGDAFRRPSSRLPLPLEMERRPREGPPARSRLTAPALDQVLEDMLGTLRARRIRAVGIMATDVRDKLFLAEVVRRELPDVLLFTFEGNALFARRDLVGSLRGMVVASSYPLMLQNVLWTGGRDFVPFAVEGAAGTFNAALHLLGRADLLQEYRAPASTRDEDRVPLWLSAVGSGTLVPLRVVDVGNDPHLPPTVTDRQVPPDARTFRPGVLDGLSVVLALLLGLAPLWVLVRFMRKPERSAEGPGPPPARGWSERLARALPDEVHSWTSPGAVLPPRDRARLRWDALDRLAVIAALLSFAAPLGVMNGTAAPWDAVVAEQRWVGVVLLIELVLVTGLLGGVLARSAWAEVRRERARHMVRRRSATRANGDSGNPVRADWLLVLLTDRLAHSLALVLTGLALLYCGRLIALATSSPATYGLYRVRTLRLESGVSGLLPLLIASVAIVFLVGWHRDRRDLIRDESRQNLEPLASSLMRAGSKTRMPHALEDVLGTIVAMRRRLELRVPNTRVLWVTIAVVLLAMSLGRVYGAPRWDTLENVSLGDGAASTWILWLGLGCGFFGVTVTVLHLFVTWRSFRAFLGALADTPLSPAFGRLPERLRAMGRLHLFDPTSGRLGRVLAESGHQAVWKEAACSRELPAQALVDVGVQRREAWARARRLRGRDTPRTRRESLEALIHVLRKSWEDDPGRIREAGPVAAPGETSEDPLERWLRRVEDVLVLECTRYVDWVLRNVRRIALLLLFVMLYTTAMLETIPFPYHSAMTTAFVLLVGLGVATVIGIMIQLAQDDILSRISGTEPGKINWNGASLVNSLIFVALPVLGLLGTEVAPVGQAMFGWVQDLLRILSSR